jgi:hypothetical protein
MKMCTTIPMMWWASIPLAQQACSSHNNRHDSGPHLNRNMSRRWIRNRNRMRFCHPIPINKNTSTNILIGMKAYMPMNTMSLKKWSPSKNKSKGTQSMVLVSLTNANFNPKKHSKWRSCRIGWGSRMSSSYPPWPRQASPILTVVSSINSHWLSSRSIKK